MGRHHDETSKAHRQNEPLPGDRKNGFCLGHLGKPADITSDAATPQYWMVQNLQKQPKTPQPKVTDLPITVPAETTNGVTTVPHTETVRIEQ